VADNTFRFLVANDIGDTSQEWRIWADGNELYIGARSTAHEYKASFHSSGQCQVGISSGLRKTLISDPNWAGKSRLFCTWTIDETATEPAYYELLEILIPDSYLDEVDFGITPAGSVLRSIPEHITSVGIIKARLPSGATLTSNAPGFEELCRIQLNNGFCAVIVKRLLPESKEYHRFVRHQFWSHFLAERTADGRTYGTKERIDQASANVRAMLWDGTQSKKYWHEVSARKLFALGPQES